MYRYCKVFWVFSSSNYYYFEHVRWKVYLRVQKRSPVFHHTEEQVELERPVQALASNRTRSHTVPHHVASGKDHKDFTYVTLSAVEVLLTYHTLSCLPVQVRGGSCSVQGVKNSWRWLAYGARWKSCTRQDYFGPYHPAWTKTGSHG